MAVTTKVTTKEKEVNKKLDADKIYRYIGPNGRFQKSMFAIHGLSYISHSWMFLGFIFMVDTPPYHCTVPPDSTYNTTIPQIDEETVDKCNMYTNYSISNDTQPCTHGYTFDRDFGYESTVVTEFELYCSYNILIEVCLMISAIGLALSQGLANYITDKYGRKNMMVISSIGRGISAIIKTFSPNMTFFIVFDFMQNLFQAIFTTAGLVMLVELFPPEIRLRFSTGIEWMWILSYGTTCLIVYLVRDWTHLVLVFNVPLLAGISFIWILPESLPWLCLNGKNVEAEKVARKAAAVNGVKLRDGIFTDGTFYEETKPLIAQHGKNNNTGKETIKFDDAESNESIQSLDSIHRDYQKRNSFVLDEMRRSSYMEADDAIKSIKRKVDDSGIDPALEDPNASLLVMFKKAPKLRRYSFINYFLWFINNLVYMSLSLTVTMLAGDRYMNFFLYWLAEIPGITFFIIVVNKVGRKMPLAVGHFLAGIGLVLTLVDLIDTDYDMRYVIMTFNFLGKVGITGSYCALVSFAPEMYPTNIRGMGMGLCQVASLMANFISPYSRVMEKSAPGVLRAVCGVLSIIAGALCFWLPETFGRPLPETLAEVERWKINISKEDRKEYIRQLEKRTNPTPDSDHL